ncbi:MAG: transglycosylase SLT domain-containing protein [Devosia nanyangense]|uniref:Transglycosylase SLT domain-containing protein n=1 Tax=Devosia nanyangense TaxID=1228055 RepID=A0A933L1C3_9HYPH|nr:transglycosylase SLT domain-containing protein [Devosia nanyangense]
MGVQPIAVPQSLALVLNTAGDKSGVDFDYLLQTAIRESSLDPEAKAAGSSAVGLFQFLDSTWLQVMKEQGPRLGYQRYAEAITRNSDGDYVIKDKALRAEVLKLREDPQVASDMAAAFTRSNGAYLEGKFGRMPSPGELYIAHFLGPQGAEKLFNAGLQNPDQVAAKLFPRQAKANHQIFYAGSHARTIKEVYRALVAQHSGVAATVTAPDPKFAAQQMASAPEGKLFGDELPSRFGPADMSFTGLFRTEAPSPVPPPLIATEGAGPLVPVKAPQVPLIPVEASYPLLAIDAALAGSQAPAKIGDPFAPPDPLIRSEAPLALVATEMPRAVVATETLPPPALQEAPRARILMTHPPADSDTSAFLTQLYGQN